MKACLIIININSCAPKTIIDEHVTEAAPCKLPIRVDGCTGCAEASNDCVAISGFFAS